MKRKLVILLMILLTFSIALAAQQNYKEGYIINNEGDTIRGFINLKTDKSLGEECNFSTVNDATPITYFPKDILEYRFTREGKKYISGTVDINKAERTVFLEYLVQGMMNLYYFQERETDQEYYFFEEESGEMRIVTQQVEEIIDGRFTKDNKYKGVVRYMFKDYPSITPKAKDIKFKKGDMVKLVKDYHEEVCTSGEDCIVFENDYKKNYTKLKFSAYAGVSFSKSTMHRSYMKHKAIVPGDTQNRKLTSSSSVMPVLGVMVDVSNSRMSDCFSALFDFSLSGINTKGEYIKLRTGKTVRDFEAQALVFGAKFGPKYTYPKGRVKPMIQAGIGTDVLFSKKSSEDVFNEVEYRTSFFNLNAAAGIDCKLNKNNFLLMRIAYDWSLSRGGGHSKNQNEYWDQDQLTKLTVKVGYTF